MRRLFAAVAAVDRKLGVIWTRSAGTLLLVLGMIALADAARADDFSVANYWPVLLLVGVFWLVALPCFRSRRGFYDSLIETYTPPPRDR